MKTTTRFALLVAALSTVAPLTNLTRADEPAEGSALDQNYQQKVLAWMDAYAKKQVLFCEEDIQRLRDDLAKDTPGEAKIWWEKTTDIREALDSLEWADTREWLREFLKVQAMVSDEQIAEFRKETKQTAQSGSTQDFTEILKEIERRRSRFRRRADKSREVRDEKLATVNAFRKDQDAWQMPRDGT